MKLFSFFVFKMFSQATGQMVLRKQTETNSISSDYDLISHLINRKEAHSLELFLYPTE